MVPGRSCGITGVRDALLLIGFHVSPLGTREAQPSYATTPIVRIVGSDDVSPYCNLSRHLTGCLPISHHEFSAGPLPVVACLGG